MTDTTPEVSILESGYTFIRFHGECFAQLPPGFCGDIIPDEYIFHPDPWNRKRINQWWREVKDA